MRWFEILILIAVAAYCGYIIFGKKKKQGCCGNCSSCQGCAHKIEKE